MHCHSIAALRNSASTSLRIACFGNAEPVVQLTLEYLIETVALVFRGVTDDRDHQSDLVCYKAMDRLAWEHMVEKVAQMQESERQGQQDRAKQKAQGNKGKRRQLPRIYFDYDGGEHSMSIESVLYWTTVKSDVRLVRALETLSPAHLGSDIDVFDAVQRALETSADVGPETDEDAFPASPQRWDQRWANHSGFANDDTRRWNSSFAFASGITVRDLFHAHQNA